MRVEVRDDDGELIWSRSPVGGFTSNAYGADGTLNRLEQALEQALDQCRGELAISMNSDRVADLGGATTQINGDIPVAGMWSSNTCR